MNAPNTTFKSKRGFITAVLAGPALAALLLQSCAVTSSGGGVGHRLPLSGSVREGQTLSLTWTSTDGGLTGSINAALDDGAAFVGPFMQVTRATQLHHFDPYWVGWRQGWRDWPASGMPSSSTDLVIHYSGRVIARLQGPGNLSMRCVLHLKTPSKGMEAGGLGQCELSDERKFDVTLS